MIFLSYILVAIAAVMNALMDRIENSIQFKVSIFKNLKPEFWCKTTSADSIKFIPFTEYRPDAWHLSKSLMIVALCLAIIFYHPFIPIVDFIILGSIWNLTFESFYNYIFKAKT